MSKEVILSNNLKLWNSVSKTDTSATKTSNRDGREQTSINGYWMIKQATEKFGMVGIGWGWDVIEERWDDGAMIPIKQDDGSTRLEQSKTHTIKLKLWFIVDGNRGEITQYGHTQSIYKSKWGVSDDGEAPKKSLMDAIKKALSMLGFCSDIFTGMFDDRDYVQQLQTEQSISKAEDRDAEVAKQKTDMIEYVERNKETLNASRSVNEAKGIAKTVLRKLELQGKIPVLAEICKRGAISVNAALNDKLKQLE